MRKNSWTRKVAFFCGGLLAVLFLAVVRVLDVPVAGVEPEAFVLTAMMTSPFTLGFLVLLVLSTAGLERLLRRRRA